MDSELERISVPISQKNYRDEIMKLQQSISDAPGAMFDDCFPLTHNFAKGLYVRQITVPANVFVVTKIHKYSHAAFLLKGAVSVMEEDGPRYIKAPASFITKAGTKRLVFHHEETIWTTVHATEETDLEKIEAEIIAKDFDELDNVVEVDSIEETTEVKEPL
jgi:hypothetical protein